MKITGLQKGQCGFHDFMRALDDDNLFLGIVEVLASLDGVIEELEETA